MCAYRKVRGDEGEHKSENVWMGGRRKLSGRFETRMVGVFVMRTEKGLETQKHFNDNTVSRTPHFPHCKCNLRVV